MTIKDHLEPESLDRVVIRFAGDSGDGMQLTGDRVHGRQRHLRQRPRDDAQLPGRDPRARRHDRRCLRFQVHISDHDILTPGDMPSVLVAMNPAALQANILELEPGGTLHRQLGRLRRPQPEKAGYQASPLEDGSLTAYRVIQVPMTSITLEATKPLGVKPRDAERSKNFFALGLLSWMYDAADRADDRVDRGEVRQPGAGARPPTSLPSRPATTSVRPLNSSTTPTRSRRPASRRAATATSPATLPSPTGSSPGRSRPPSSSLRVVPDHPGVGHPPRAVPPQELRRSARSRPRTRSPRSASRSVPRSPASSASPPRAGPAST